jgi:hypothetical protein
MTVYLPRSAWGARPSKGPTNLSSAKLVGTALHWPGMGDTQVITKDQVARRLRGWQDYHMDPEPKGHGWSDIAYQIAVDQAGRVWTLRGLTTRSAANGDAEVNLAYGAILLIVGSGEAPTTALVESTRNVIADFRRLYPRATRIRPHSAVRPDPTDCPGNPVRTLIDAGAFEPLHEPTPEETVTPAQMNQILGNQSLNVLWLHYRSLDDAWDVAIAEGRPQSVIVALSEKTAVAKTAYEKKAAELS